MIDGTKIVEARQELGWTRNDFLDHANEVAAREGLQPLTYSKVTQIESARRDARPEEEALIRRVLTEALDRVITGEFPVVEEPQGYGRFTEWNGLKSGDLCRVAGLKKSYKFIAYYVDSKQTYVEVSGPVVTFQGKSFGLRTRCLLPEKILRHKS